MREKKGVHRLSGGPWSASGSQESVMQVILLKQSPKLRVVRGKYGEGSGFQATSLIDQTNQQPRHFFLETRRSCCHDSEDGPW